MKENLKATVVHYHRKRHLNSNSLEFIFEDVRTRLVDKFNFKVKTLSKHSSGIFGRLYNLIEAIFYQAEVNHITGDTHYIACLLHKNRTILTIHDCGFLNTKNVLKREIYKFVWLTLPINRVSYITAISEATKRDILKYSSARPEKVIVIPVAVSERFKPSPRAFNEKYPTLLQVGTTPNKNIVRLVPAIGDIQCKLVIIGEISDHERQLLKTYRIDYENRWNLTNAEILQEYINCDIVTFASTFEGFGMPIIEANCIERPVLAGNNSSMIEVAGYAACLVDAESIEEIRNGILKIINDKEYREELIKQGRENKLKYDAQRIATQYESLYNRMLTRNRHPTNE